MKIVLRILLSIATVIVVALLSNHVETQKDLLFFLVFLCL